MVFPIGIPYWLLVPDYFLFPIGYLCFSFPAKPLCNMISWVHLSNLSKRSLLKVRSRRSRPLETYPRVRESSHVGPKGCRKGVYA